MTTFLFTDLEGSTKLLVAAGAEFAADLAVHNRLLHEAVLGHGGEVIGLEGDSVHAVFADPVDAVAAALDGQVALSAHRFAAGEVRVRIGVHTGAGEATEAGYVGLGLHLADRVCTAANGGQVLASAETLAAVRPWPAEWQTYDHGPHELKDIAGAVTLVEVAGGGHALSTAAPRAPRPAWATLPRRPAVVLGRDDERAEIAAALAPEAIVSIVGPGGVGKTTLALDVAHHAASHGRPVRWVDLAPVGSGEDVEAAVDDALGMAVGGAGSRSGALVVLDNCEHVLDAAAAAASRLAAAGSLVLVTSREPLESSGETEIRLDPLREDDAVALLQSRAAARGARVMADGPDLTNARRVVHAVDLLPLGVELAAARLRSMSLADLADRLLAGVGVLRRRGADPDDRQRTLDAVIEWSWRLLDDRARTLLSRTALFRGPFTAEGAAAVARVDDAVALDTLDDLVAKSLVAFDPSHGRYRLLDTVRRFALVRLDDHGAAARAHLQWTAAAAAAYQHLAPGGYSTQAWWEAMRPSVADVVDAIDWGLEMDGDDAHTAALLTAFVLPLWQTGAWITHGRWVVEQAVHALDDGPPADKAAVLYTRARLARTAGEERAAQRDLEDALARAREAGSVLHEMAILLDLGQVSGTDDLAAAQRRLHELVELSRRFGAAVMEAHALNGLAAAAVVEGRIGDARRLLRQTIDVVAASGAPTGPAAIACVNLSAIARLQGDVDTAIDLVREGLRLGGDAAIVLIRGAVVLSGHLAAAGQLDQARVVAEWADREAELADDPWARNAAWAARARVLLDLGDVATGRQLAAQAMAGGSPDGPGWFDTCTTAARAARMAGEPAVAVGLLEPLVGGRFGNDRFGTSVALIELGRSRLGLGDPNQAAVAFQRAFDAASEVGHPEAVARALEGLADVALTSNRVAAAGRFLGMAAVVQPPGLTVDRWRAADLERIQTEVVARLGEEEAARALEAGRREAPARPAELG